MLLSFRELRTAANNTTVKSSCIRGAFTIHKRKCSDLHRVAQKNGSLAVVSQKVPNISQGSAATGEVVGSCNYRERFVKIR